MALGEGSLRTRQLTEQLPTYAPRTIYRHAMKLASLGLVQRHEEPGVPSRVVYCLAKPEGHDLLRLLEGYLHKGDDVTWTSLALLGEMWGSGWVGRLSQEGLSSTELADVTAGLTFHQVKRRTEMLRSRGLIAETGGRGRGRRYGLGDNARRGMGVVVGFGRWLQERDPTVKDAGLTAAEMQVVLRASLPLVGLPGKAGKAVKLGIVGDGELGDEDSQALLASIRANGTVECEVDDGVPVDAWAVGSITAWYAVLLDGNRGQLRTGGNLKLVDECLKGLNDALWGAS